jgi:hypothetical protein
LPSGKSQNQDRQELKGSPKLMGANGSPFRYGELEEGNLIKRVAKTMRTSGEQDWLQLAMIVIEELTVEDLRDLMPAKIASIAPDAVELHA